MAAAAAGIVIGVWTSLMTYTYSPCGPHQLCVILLAAGATIASLSPPKDAKDMNRFPMGRAVGEHEPLHGR